FMPGVSRDEQILGRQTQAPSAPEATPRQPEERPATGSLLEQIQREVDEAEAVPVPIPEPLETE
ncbi:hypothetical protein ACC728_39055, partial [Rhizobium ruizarguesonis]